MLGEYDSFVEYLTDFQVHRAQLTLTKQDTQVPNVWEISAFIDNYSSYYYKQYLLNTISALLKMGIHPANIFILDKSIRVSQLRKNNILHHVDFASGDRNDYSLNQLYGIGSPHSIYPNRDISILHWLFGSFRRLNQFVLGHTGKHLPTRLLNCFAKDILCAPYKHRRALLFLRAVRSYSEMLLKGKGEKTYAAHHKGLLDLLSAARNGYREIALSAYPAESDIVFFEPISKGDERHKAFGISKSIDRFFDSFAKVKRPVVGVYLKELRRIELLGLMHINAEYTHPEFLDLRSMGHSSPSLYEFIGSILSSVGSLKKNLNDDRRADQLHKKAMELMELQIKIKIQELLQAEERTKQESLKTQILDIQSMLWNMELCRRKQKEYRQASMDAPADSYHKQLLQYMEKAGSSVQFGTDKLLQESNFKVTKLDIRA